VEINEMFADFFEEIDGDGRVVDELTVGRGADGATDDDLGVVAGRESTFFEDGVDFGGIGKIEHRFDGAGVLTGTDEVFIGTFAEDHFQSADDDGFPSTRFTSDRDQARAEFPYEFVNECEIANFEEGEHAFTAGEYAGA
jgi:hypothetical protein